MTSLFYANNKQKFVKIKHAVTALTAETIYTVSQKTCDYIFYNNFQ